MATFIEIANRLGKQFVSSKNKTETANLIIQEIKGLIYSESKKQLTQTDRELIVKYIGEFISGARPFQYKEGGQIILTEQRDNSDYLDLVDYILDGLKK